MSIIMRITQAFSIATLLVLAGGCSPTQGKESTTLILAHRASSGLWHQNSRNAVIKSIRAAHEGELEGRFHGIELDIVLTKDAVPVLSHEPWIHKSLCVQSNGSKVGYVLIRDMDFNALQHNYLCGGIPDPEFPNSKIKAERVIPPFITVVKSRELLSSYRQFLNRCYAANAHVRSVIVVRP